MRIAPLMLATAVAWAAVSPTAAAAPCAGFHDVEANEPFCAGVEWMKNRSITTGCATAAFCPSSDVGRLHAAAFLSRFGTTLAPNALHKHVVAFRPTLPAPPATTLLCATADYRVDGFPRRARFVGRAELIDFFAYPNLTGILWVYSTDAGVNWHTVGSLGVDVYPVRLGSAIDSAPANVTVLAPPMMLVPDASYRFGLIGSGSGWEIWGSVSCSLDVTIENVNPTTPL